MIAAEDSSFATPEISVGCYPPVALARFSSLIGYHRAAEMILTGRRYTAQEALAIGLINRIAPADQFDDAVAALLQEILAKSGSVLRIVVKGVRELALKDFPAALKRSEEIYCTDLLGTLDVDEGVRAFLAKRTPSWTHK